MKNTWKQISITLVLVLNLLISYAQRHTKYLHSDTTQSFEINNKWVITKQTFDFNSLVKAENDTLYIVTCSDYVYFPFGNLTDKSRLEKLFKQFHTVEKLTVEEKGVISYRLKNKSSTLSLQFDNDSEESIHSYIVKGEIDDNNVRFVNKIQIGMSIRNFYDIFFDYIPIEFLKEFKVIIFESCVTDILHIYNFENANLVSVKFVKQ